MNNEDKKIESLEKETRYTIISLDTDDTNEKKSILDNAQKELDSLFVAFKEYKDKHFDPEDVNEKLEKLKVDCKRIIDQTKVKLNEFNQREDVIKGKEKLSEVSDKVFTVVEGGIHEVMKNEYVSKTVDTIGDTVTAVCEDERVKQNVKKLKKGTLKLAEKAFLGLQRVLDTDDEDK